MSVSVCIFILYFYPLSNIQCMNMSYYCKILFSAELTCIPHIVDKYIGNYCSNAVGNAITWVFIMWMVIHYVFDSYLNILLQQMQYKEYVSIRLTNALWYCGFYCTGFLYCVGTVICNSPNISDYQQNLITPDNNHIPLHMLMGLGLIGTFFLQSFTWNCMKFGFDCNTLTFLTLTFLSLTTFYSRRVELLICVFALTTLLHFINNFLRCLICVTDKKQSAYINGLFYGSLCLFVIVHIIVIPIFFIVPLFSNLKYELNISAILFLTSFIIWWTAEGLSNPLYKYLDHWIKHVGITNPRLCPNNILICCLFPIRDDFNFNLSIEKRDIKQREHKSVIRRKPKDQGVFVKSLKFMVAFRRKLKNKGVSIKPHYSSSKQDPLDNNSDASSEEEVEDNMKDAYQEDTARGLQDTHNESDVRMNVFANLDEYAECKKND